MQSIARREMLKSSLTAAIGLGLATGAAAQSQLQETQRGKTKLKVIVTGGHPGDPEYGCGGTVARYSDQGHAVVLLYLNRGELPGKPEGKGVRVAEAAKAGEILNSRPAYAGQIDGHAIVDPAHYEVFRELLKTEQPNLVFTHWPIDNHADHRAISMLVYDAWLHM